ncbi:glycosyl hydrolases family 25 [Lentilactobacillus sunkii]|jgi:lysozyme|uniref:Glycosyl hydrolases family 25 n=1 Tax=Lentilactobacillus sunkii TaxID=481719 RepID=A0A1E7XJI1_9LACO|nr:GH25 family lysozyme [Lentilactobacillus sunkii]OFA13251.1 glycosyl hydrolases family 25 [Lentilactobacillus sunkii]
MKKYIKNGMAVLGLLAGGILLGTSTTANAALTPSSSQPTANMVDVSSWQSNLTAANYQTLAQNGVTAVTIKASEGTGYTNPYLLQQVQYAQQAGLSVNFYHFVHFTSVAQAQAEAQQFINSVKSVTSSTNVVMVADFESSELAGVSKAQNDTNLAAFDTALNQAGYNKTDLYTMASWLGVHIDTNTTNQGWIADYPGTPTGNKYPNANAWQWASDYRFPSIAQNLDVSQMNNSYYLNSGTVTPSNNGTGGSSSSSSSSASSASAASSASSSSTSSKNSKNKGSVVLVPGPSAGKQYSAARSASVRLVWRSSMGQHYYTTTKGARYSKHLGTRYGYNADLPDVTWVTDAHEKLYKKNTGKYAIYYHVKSTVGNHGGWIWRGYLTSGSN